MAGDTADNCPVILRKGRKEVIGGLVDTLARGSPVAQW
jgi:hypothetical protein